MKGRREGIVKIFEQKLFNFYMSSRSPIFLLFSEYRSIVLTIDKILKILLMLEKKKSNLSDMDGFRR